MKNRNKNTWAIYILSNVRSGFKYQISEDGSWFFKRWKLHKKPGQIQQNQSDLWKKEIIDDHCYPGYPWLPKNSTTRESRVRPLSALFSHRRKSDQQCRHAFSGAYMRCHAQIQWKHGIAQGTWCVQQNCFLHNPSSKLAIFTKPIPEVSPRSASEARTGNQCLENSGRIAMRSFTTSQLWITRTTKVIISLQGFPHYILSLLVFHYYPK